MSDVSVWAYPWDLHDIGMDTALSQIGAQGANMVSLATSYHAGRFLQPGNPRRRVYFPQDGTVYYRVDQTRWTNREIRPLQADIVETEGDYLDAMIRQRDKGGAGVSCWTVCLHNTRLGLAHPEHVMRTAHGDPCAYALCPSSPAARDYVVGLCAEISERYRPDRIELESPDFMGFDHGFHHEKDGLGLLPEDKFLLGLCFCDHCKTRAKAAGVPADEAQIAVRTLLDDSFGRELPEPQFPDFPESGIQAFAGRPEVMAYHDWRTEPVASLIENIRAETHADTQVLLIDAVGTWWGGVDLDQIAPHIDGVLACVYFDPAEQIPAILGRMRQVLGPDKKLIAGFQLFHPEVADKTDLCARVRAASGLADGYNFYNLGLVPPARLEWMRAALNSAQLT